MSLDRVTVFIGENNAGKTSFLAALDVVFGSAHPSQDDLHIESNGARATRFVVDIRIRPADRKTDFEDAMRTRFKGAIQFPDASSETEYVVIRTIVELDATGAIALQRRFVRGWACGRADALALQVLPEHPQNLQLELLAFFLLDAKRDLVEDLRARRSHWGRLLSELEISSQAKSQIEKQLDLLSNEIINSSAVLAGVKKELQNVRDALANSVSDVRISPLPGRIEELARGVDVLMEAPSGKALPIRLNGQGARSFAAVLVFKSFVEQRVGQTQTFRPQVCAAFEEPEAHLHPQAHRAMFHLISELDAQVIVSTHSPYVVRVVKDVHCLRLLRQLPDGAATCSSVPEKTGTSPTFSEEDHILLRRFLLRNNGEALFSKMAVIFEGETEDAALPVFAKARWKRDHTALGLSFCKTDGAQSGKHVVRLLNLLKIPWVVFAEGDAAGSRGLVAIESTLGRPLISGQDYVQLTKDQSFEQYLIAQGYRSTIERAVADCHGATALAEYRRVHHGMDLNRNEKRDYQAAGWEDRLVEHYCKSYKGVLGEHLATGIVSHAQGLGVPSIPPAITALFDRIDVGLKTGA